MTDEIRRLIEDKFFVAGQMDAQGHAAEKFRIGSGGTVLAMSRRLLQEARALLAAEPPPTEAPPDPQGRLLLNAYGRHCYDLGYAAGESTVSAAPPPADPSPCPVFRPDHNGECLNCDEWADAHTPDATERGQLLAMARDWLDPAVVRDAPERVPHVIAQLIAEIEKE